MKTRNEKKQRGFTLIEVMVATFLVGIAVAALVAASVSYTQANGAGIHLSTSEFLIEEIRELSMVLAFVDPETGTDVFGAEEGAIANFDDVDDLDGQRISPPVDMGRNTLDHFGGFEQIVTVENVSASSPDTVVSDHGSNLVRVTVSVELDGIEMARSSWLRAAQ